MRILVVGAYGLIGSYVTARLLADGHEIVAAGRDVRMAVRRWPQVRWIRVDLGRMTVADWRGRLDGIDAVINCAGALQDSPSDRLAAVHRDGVLALAEACREAGVRRFVQISALGVERTRGVFAETKREADEALMATGLDWAVIRPGLVLAPGAKVQETIFLPAGDPSRESWTGHMITQAEARDTSGIQSVHDAAQLNQFLAAVMPRARSFLTTGGGRGGRGGRGGAPGDAESNPWRADFAKVIEDSADDSTDNKVFYIHKYFFYWLVE